jgi:phosphate transport system substrate-binding protein
MGSGKTGGSGGSGSESLTGTGRSRASTIGMGTAIAIAVVLLAVGLGGGYFLYSAVNPSKSSSSTIQLTETGSSLLFPLVNKYWAANYTAYNPGVVVSSASTGSGTGQSDAEKATVNLGGSDGYVWNASSYGVMNLPVAISAQLVWYNLPSLNAKYHLNLNGTVLGLIYDGKITAWNNAEIEAAQNASVNTELNATSPSQIHVFFRGDGSGDTYIFSSYCYESDPSWNYSYSTGALEGLKDFGSASFTAETGNGEMVTGVEGQTGGIAYIGISYPVTGTGLNYAYLGDNLSITKSGGTNPANYVTPNATNIASDANLGLAHLNYAKFGLAVSLIQGGNPANPVNLTLGAGGTNPAAGTTPYPIVNLEYMLLKTAPTGSTVTAAALHATVEFLYWAISYGNFGSGGVPSTYINAVHFLPLTQEVIGYDMEALGSIS